MELLRRYRHFFIFITLSLLARFWNLSNSLYFIWDQGRDAWAIQRILSGDITLIGPTSGLPGFFLGPLWFYAGIPGYVLSGGNPYGISAGYMLLGSLALPLYWLLAHHLFVDKQKAQILAYAFSFLSGSLAASVFIWNPIISLPLVAGALYSLLRSRADRRFLVLGFFLFALTLQSEFAYAVFFLGPLWLAIPWIRQRWDWRDFAATALAVAVTLVPQILFEIRHNFVMSKALLMSLQDTSRQVGWLQLWQNRPEQLLDSTRRIMVGTIGTAWLVEWGVVACVAVAIWSIWKQPKDVPLQKNFEWKLLSLLSLLPYAFYMMWRGNYGYFFSYYITPHFIFLTPLLVFGVLQIWEQKVRFLQATIIRYTAIMLVAGGTLLGGLHTLDTSIVFPENNAGLAAMISAVDTVFAWQKADGINQSVVQIYTPNVQTEHYDYLFQWRARTNDIPVPLTIRGDQTHWYLLMEEDEARHNLFFLPWYATATQGGVLTRKEKRGPLTLESWQTPVLATQAAILKP